MQSGYFRRMYPPVVSPGNGAQPSPRDSGCMGVKAGEHVRVLELYFRLLMLSYLWGVRYFSASGWLTELGCHVLALGMPQHGVYCLLAHLCRFPFHSGGAMHMCDPRYPHVQYVTAPCTRVMQYVVDDRKSPAYRRCLHCRP